MTHRGETTRSAMLFFEDFLFTDKKTRLKEGLDTPKTATSFFCTLFFEVLPFTDDASVVNGKTSKKSMQKTTQRFLVSQDLKKDTYSGPHRKARAMLHHTTEHARIIHIFFKKAWQAQETVMTFKM